MGRWPTVGELFEYYSRDDICAVMYYQSKRWKILMNFGDNYLLEPESERDTREKMLRKLRDFTEGMKETERLPKYPTMHILRDRGESAPVRYDFMLESDPKSWSQAFSDMAKNLDVLEAQDAYYQIKFSGHRSLHLLIPAESFPRIFRDKSVNEQFGFIEKVIKNYLPRKGHTTIGLRVVYSTHPIGALASIPLRREEIPNFQPWMANIHTVAVDFDWFQIPEDAVERNEKFLHTVFDNQRAKSVTVSLPAFEPLAVKTYTGDMPLSEAEILRTIDSEHYQERIAAARAALIQNIQLPQEKLKTLLRDDEGDVLWFAMEIALRDTPEIEVEDIVHLLSQKDDDIIELGRQLLTQSGLGVHELCDYLGSQRTINRYTVVATSYIAEMDWQALVTLPMNIKAASLQEWFEKVWSVCGSALCLSSQRQPEAIFENAYLQAKTFVDTGLKPASTEEVADKIHQLSLLLKLRNTQPRKRVRDEPLFQAADELIQYGYDLREIVLAMLDGPQLTMHGAVRYLTRLWWDDSVDLLIERLGSSSSRRKGALKALVDIGEPAVEPLMDAVRTSPNQLIIIMSVDALGRIGDTRAIPVIEERVNHPNKQIRKNAQRVLRTYFGIEMQPNKVVTSAPDASEVEEH